MECSGYYGGGQIKNIIPTNLRIERNCFSGIFEKILLATQPARPPILFGQAARRPPPKLAAPPPSTKIGQRAATNTMTSAHGSMTQPQFEIQNSHFHSFNPPISIAPL